MLCGDWWQWRCPGSWSHRESTTDAYEDEYVTSRCKKVPAGQQFADGPAACLLALVPARLLGQVPAGLLDPSCHSPPQAGPLLLSWSQGFGAGAQEFSFGPLSADHAAPRRGPHLVRLITANALRHHRGVGLARGSAWQLRVGRSSGPRMSRRVIQDWVMQGPGEVPRWPPTMLVPPPVMGEPEPLLSAETSRPLPGPRRWCRRGPSSLASFEGDALLGDGAREQWCSCRGHIAHARNKEILRCRRVEPDYALRGAADAQPLPGIDRACSTRWSLHLDCINTLLA